MSGEWVVFDYGAVLCTDQQPGDLAAIEAAAGTDDPLFWHAYWKYRPAYDRADLTPSAYWASVLGRPPAPDQLIRLDRLDVASWLHPQQATLDLVTELAGRGTNLALFSNAPVGLAAAVDRLDWLGPIEHRYYSCRLRQIKPDADAYTALLRELGAEPGAVTFIDDREPNVAGANDVGLRGVRFTGAERLAVDLGLAPKGDR